MSFRHNKTFVAKTFCHNKTFVVTNICSEKQFCCDTFCYDKSMLVRTKLLLRQNSLLLQIFVATRVIFVMTKDVFCHDTTVCHDKHVFVMTKVLLWQNWYLWHLPPVIHFCCDKYLQRKTILLRHVLLRQKYACQDKTFVATKFFVATNICCNKGHICHDKRCVLSWHNCLSWQTCVCYDKSFVVTKLILVASPASDTLLLWQIFAAKNNFVATHFVTTKVCLSGQNFCCDKILCCYKYLLQQGSYLSWQKMCFVMTQPFVMTNMCLSWQKFCCDKTDTCGISRQWYTFVVTNICSEFFFFATRFVTTKVCLSGQNFCCDKILCCYKYLLQQGSYLSWQKMCFVMTQPFVMTNMCLSWQKFCCDKTDTCGISCQWYTSAARKCLHSPKTPTSVYRSIFSWMDWMVHLEG